MELRREHVTAPMQGTVVAVDVAPGTLVAVLTLLAARPDVGDHSKSRSNAPPPMDSSEAWER